MMDKETATLAAQALCNNLGQGWMPRVWENMGWHYRAQFVGVDGEVLAEVRTQSREGDRSQLTFVAQIRPGLVLGSVGLKNGGLGATMQIYGYDDDSPIKAMANARRLLAEESRKITDALTIARQLLDAWEETTEGRVGDATAVQYLAQSTKASALMSEQMAALQEAGWAWDDKAGEWRHPDYPGSSISS